MRAPDWCGLPVLVAAFVGQVLASAIPNALDERGMTFSGGR
jgi:hypothetical protein